MLFVKKSATLPSGFSGSCQPHNVAKQKFRPEQGLETPFSPVYEHQWPFYLAENDAGTFAATCNTHESSGQHIFLTHPR
jgi:hypothetical protein